ncbi:hypothetical protein Rhopal_006286-T1 [Rhodotorula paludigena]|uniref:Uncharacterized protein n=1 Tax=Rhodotorula paludigena TaxID=86838 RepID=A0AAV5GTG7_9BASI|nr:hypothetical protein Rhopal_006286-T1 [Rhodotorula paludigena]
MTLFKPQLGDAHLLAMVASSRNTLEALALRKSDCFSRFALVGTLRLLPNLLELELSACTFARPDDDTAAAAPVPAPALGLPLSPARRPPMAVPPHSALSLPPEWNLLAPGTPSHAALTRRVSPAELAHPLDYLARLCPFLHVLVLASAPQPAGARRQFATRLAVDEREALVSQEAVPRLMAELPLQSLELDLSAPVIEASDVLEGLKRAGGRLESLFIGKELRWEREDLDKVISASSTSRTTVSGEIADYV